MYHINKTWLALPKGHSTLGPFTFCQEEHFPEFKAYTLSNGAEQQNRQEEGVLST